MKFLLATLAFSFQVSIQAETLSIPKIFEDGEVAEAADFNQNFEYLRNQIDSNASWLNRDLEGAKEVNVDCSDDPDALRLAYQKNSHVRTIAFYVTGACYGALNYIPVSGEDGTTSWGFISPPGQAFMIASDKNASSKVTIIPRSAHGLEKAYLGTTYGGAMSLQRVDITMGADDNFGVLIYTGSTAEINSISVNGSGNNPLGIDVVDGSVLQLSGDSEVKGVRQAIRVKNNSLVRNKGTIHAEGKVHALALDGSGWVDDDNVGQVGHTHLDGSLFMENRALATLNALLVGAKIRILSASKANINYFGSLRFEAEVELSSSGLTIVTGTGGNSNYDISRFSCYGMSELNIENLDVRNQGGKNCLDDTAWNTVINATFP